MITICSKTEHVRKAIELDPFQSSQFIWVDFGIIHVFKNDDIKFDNALSNIQNNSYDNVRIGSIWDPELYDAMCLNFNTNIYKFLSLNSKKKFCGTNGLTAAGSHFGDTT